VRGGRRKLILSTRLREYLESNSSEVRNMLLTEWNWKDAEEVWKEEAKEEAEEEILEKLTELVNKGISFSEAVEMLRKRKRCTKSE